jgi:hypothetical protein
MAMSENTQTVFKYLQGHNEGLTAQEIADATGLGVKQVNGAFTMGIQRKEFGYRSEEKVKVELEDGSTIEGKQLFLNDAGMAADVDALAAAE